MNTHDIFRDLFDSIESCGYNYCEIKVMRGMGTTGGCRCSERQLRRALRIAKKAIVEQEKRETEVVRAHLVEVVHVVSEAIHEALVSRDITVADITVKTTAERWQLVRRGTGEVLADGAFGRARPMEEKPQ